MTKGFKLAAALLSLATCSCSDIAEDTTESVERSMKLEAINRTANVDMNMNDAVEAAVEATAKEQGLEHDVELLANVPRTTQFGKPVELTIVLMNHGSELVAWGQVNGYQDCRIRVFDSRNQLCPFTPFGYCVLFNLGEGEWTTWSCRKPPIGTRWVSSPTR